MVAALRVLGRFAELGLRLDACGVPPEAGAPVAEPRQLAATPAEKVAFEGLVAH
jgi:hypothetical protein